MEPSTPQLSRFVPAEYKAPVIKEIVVKTRTIICQSQQTERTTEEELF